MTTQEIAKLIAYIATAWPGWKADPRTVIPVYSDIFTAYAITAEEARAAVLKLIGDGWQDAPAASKIVATVRQLRRGQVDTLSAADAWSIAVASCTSQSKRAEYPKLCGDIAARALASVGSWHQLRFADQQTQLPHIRKAFIEAYVAIEKAETLNDGLRQVIGIEEEKRNINNILRLINGQKVDSGSATRESKKAQETSEGDAGVGRASASGPNPQALRIESNGTKSARPIRETHQAQKGDRCGAENSNKS